LTATDTRPTFPTRNDYPDQETVMSAFMDQLVAAVHRVESVEQAAVVAFQSLADRLSKAAMSNDTEEVGSLAQELMASASALAAAIPANTDKPVDQAAEPAPVDNMPVIASVPPPAPEPVEEPAAFEPEAEPQTTSAAGEAADVTPTGPLEADAELPADPTKDAVQDGKPVGAAPGTDPTTTTGE
jgi:hypothetical protein